MKPHCYECKWRGDVPGDAHSSCHHPAVQGGEGGIMGALVDMLSGKHDAAAATLNIQGDPHGVRMMWFLWPANFDPIWLRNCNGFESKNTPAGTAPPA